MFERGHNNILKVLGCKYSKKSRNYRIELLFLGRRNNAGECNLDEFKVKIKFGGTTKTHDMVEIALCLGQH